MKYERCPYCDNIIFPNQIAKCGWHQKCIDDAKGDYLRDLKKDEKFEED